MMFNHSSISFLGKSMTTNVISIAHVHLNTLASATKSGSFSSDFVWDVLCNTLRISAHLFTNNLQSWFLEREQRGSIQSTEEALADSMNEREFQI